MSFASETKNELARIEPEQKCCMLAEISGFLRVAGSIGLVGFGKFKIIITTDNPAVARHYKKLIQDYFGIETKLEIGEGKAVGKNRSSRKFSYSITIDADNRSEQILRETGILLVREGNNYISDGIYSGIVRTKCCKKAYLRGVFMGAGTMSDPEKGYDLEFVLESATMAADLKKLINSFVDLSCKVTERRGKHVVYMKKADYISDMLAIMGASSQVFSMEETRIKKEMVGSARRMSNCDSANMDRSIEASMKHIEAIKKIQKTKGLASLPETLREAAELRLENPDVSLTALGEMCEPSVKKAAISKRLKKIEEIAVKL